jgi:hypothetical protein
MNFVDDVDFELSPHRSHANIRAERSNIIDPAIGCTVDFQHVDVIPSGDPVADFALITRNTVHDIRAVQCLRQNSGGRRFSDSTSPRKHVGMSNSASTNGIPKCSRNMFLPDDVVKRLRPKTPSQNGVMRTCRHCDVLNSVK